MHYPSELNVYTYAEFLSVESATCAKCEVSLLDCWTKHIILIEMMKKKHANHCLNVDYVSIINDIELMSLVTRVFKHLIDIWMCTLNITHHIFMTVAINMTLKNILLTNFPFSLLYCHNQSITSVLLTLFFCAYISAL